MEYRLGKCSACGAEYKIPSSFQHDAAKCKECGGVVQIGPVQPARSGAAPAPVPARRFVGPRDTAPARGTAESPAAPERPAVQPPAAPAAAAAAAPRVPPTPAPPPVQAPAPAPAPAAADRPTTLERLRAERATQEREEELVASAAPAAKGTGAGRRSSAPARGTRAAPAGKQPKSKRTLVVASVVAALVLAAGAAFFLSKGNGEAQAGDAESAAPASTAPAAEQPADAAGAQTEQAGDG